MLGGKSGQCSFLLLIRMRSISYRQMPTKQKTSILAVLALLFTASMWGIIWYPLRLLDMHGLSGLWSTLVVYSAAFIVGLYSLTQHWRAILSHRWIALLMLLFGGWTNIAFILAVLDGNVVRVLLLFYLSPIWAVLFGWLFLHERPTRVTMLAFVIAMSGAICMLWDPTATRLTHWSYTDWLALSSGIAFAATNVTVRKAQELAIWSKSVVTWIGVSLLAAILIVALDIDIPDVAPEIYGYAILLGMFGMVLMTLAVQYGVTHMPVQYSSIILLFELVAGALSSQLLTNEQVLFQEWIGGAMIIFAAIIVATQVTGRQR